MGPGPDRDTEQAPLIVNAINNKFKFCSTKSTISVDLERTQAVRSVKSTTEYRTLDLNLSNCKYGWLPLASVYCICRGSGDVLNEANCL